MKLYFVTGNPGYDREDPILVLADSKEEAESFVKFKDEPHWKKVVGENVFEDDSPNERGRAGKGHELKKGIIWKQYNAG